MRRVLSLLTAAVLSVGGLALVSAPAQAATGVTLTKIADRQVTYLGSAVIKASYRSSGPVRISETAITVTNAGKTIAKSKPAVRLRAGTYTVGQRVTYRVKQRNGKYSAVKNVRSSQSLTIRQSAKNCATTADVATVVTYGLQGDSETIGDESATVSTKLFSSGRRLIDPVTLGEIRDEIENDDEDFRAAEGVPVEDDSTDDEGDPELDALIERFGEDAVYIVKAYRACSKNDLALVDFIDGRALTADYFDDFDEVGEF